MNRETDMMGQISLRLSVVDVCQFRCMYCSPDGNHVERHHGISPMTTDEIVRFVRFLNGRYRLRKVHITGGEPLLRDDIVDLVVKLSSLGIGDIALTTNGQLLGGMAQSLKDAGLRRITISLDSLIPGTFERMTGGGILSDTLAGIDSAVACGFSPVKINMVVLRNVNDAEAVNIARFGLERSCQVRFLELMPVGISTHDFRDWFVPSSEVRGFLEGEFTWQRIHARRGVSSTDFNVCSSDGMEGVIGFISPYSSPFCEGCSRLRLSARGMLSGCLAQRERYDIRQLLNDDTATSLLQLHDAVCRAQRDKRNGGSFDAVETMLTIGG